MDDFRGGRRKETVSRNLFRKQIKLCSKRCNNVPSLWGEERAVLPIYVSSQEKEQKCGICPRKIWKEYLVWKERVSEREKGRFVSCNLKNRSPDFKLFSPWHFLDFKVGKCCTQIFDCSRNFQGKIPVTSVNVFSFLWLPNKFGCCDVALQNQIQNPKLRSIHSIWTF